MAVSLAAALARTLPALSTVASALTESGVPLAFGYVRASDYSRERLSRSGRWLADLVRLHGHFLRLPALRAAVTREDGGAPLHASSALALGGVATDPDVKEWIAAARRLTLAELRQVIRSRRGPRPHEAPLEGGGAAAPGGDRVDRTSLLHGDHETSCAVCTVEMSRAKGRTSDCDTPSGLSSAGSGTFPPQEDRPAAPEGYAISSQSDGDGHRTLPEPAAQCNAPLQGAESAARLRLAGAAAHEMAGGPASEGAGGSGREAAGKAGPETSSGPAHESAGPAHPIDDAGDPSELRLLAPPLVRAAFRETLELFRAVEGSEATVTSFVEALVAEASTGPAPVHGIELHDQAHTADLRHAAERDVVESALAKAASGWKHLPARRRVPSGRCGWPGRASRA